MQESEGYRKLKALYHVQTEGPITCVDAARYLPSATELACDGYESPDGPITLR